MLGGGGLFPYSWPVPINISKKWLQSSNSRISKKELQSNNSFTIIVFGGGNQQPPRNGFAYF